nr:ligase-associated DNA damage response endonuclease PdeM [Belliella kenyensis]
MILLPERVIYIPSWGALLIADTHFGKAGHFRKAGIPIPEALHEEDLAKLSTLIREFGISDIYFLGDLFHSELNDSWWTLMEFTQQHERVTFHLIMGNHDILPASCYQHQQWKVYDEGLIKENFILTHEPLENVPDGFINVCGHIHPGLTLRGKGKQKMTLPCFYYNNQRLVLPAYGRFTGLVGMQGTSEDQFFVIANDKIVEFSPV